VETAVEAVAPPLYSAVSIAVAMFAVEELPENSTL
jgi:hypothetical protein